MEIKRIFKKENGEAMLDADGVPILDEQGNPVYQQVLVLDGGQPVLDHIKVKRLSKRQNFTQKLIDRAVREGFMTLSKGKVILHTGEGDLDYKILRSPGYFCCHDNKALGGEKECQEYVEDNFKGVISPDKNNPSGYRKDNFHACELQEEI